MTQSSPRSARWRRAPARRAAAVGLVLLALAGCLGRSPRVRAFVLGSEGLPPAAVMAPEVAVLVGPVRLPAYLERPQLVRLAGAGEVRLDEQNRWLGGFEENFLRAVSNGVAARLGSPRVVPHPSSAPFAFDYRVRLHVDELIRDAEDVLRVRIRWVLLRGDAGPVGPIEILEQRMPVGGEGSAALVEAHARVCAALAVAIADRIADVARTGGGGEPASGADPGPADVEG